MTKILTTKELIDKIKRLHYYKITEYDTGLGPYLGIYDSLGHYLCGVSKTKLCVISTYHLDFRNVHLSDRIDLLDLIYEYSKLPTSTKNGKTKSTNQHLSKREVKTLTTKELINELKKLNYNITEDETDLTIHDSMGNDICVVSKIELCMMDTDYQDFIKLDISDKIELLDLIYEYSKLPTSIKNDKNNKTELINLNLSQKEIEKLTEILSNYIDQTNETDEESNKLYQTFYNISKKGENK